jgi:hypothetical protein
VNQIGSVEKIHGQKFMSGDIDGAMKVCTPDFKMIDGKGKSLSTDQEWDEFRAFCLISTNRKIAVDVTAINVQGETATLDYKTKLTFDMPGQKNRVAQDSTVEDDLVKQGGAWKLADTRTVSQVMTETPMR